MTTNWREVWNRRRLSEGRPIDLQDLLHIDGYDSAASPVAVANWRQYVNAVATKLDLSGGSSIYEVGCGAGALLSTLKERLRLEVGGCDFSSPLISVAGRVMPDGDFTVSEATEFPIDPRYDFVLSNGVFLYFPDLDYARRVLERMAAKARFAIAVLEVPDVATREASEAKRRALLSPDEYDRKYRGLNHLYFPRSWFHEMAEKLSMDCTGLEARIPDYAQAEFRFGVLLRSRARS
jgi:trans-aconitate methyltransferase